MAALASQSLAIMISLIPYIRETFRRHLSTKQAVMLIEFDKLKRDYQEHQNEIHAKLIAIMGDRLTAHIRTLQVRFPLPILLLIMCHRNNSAMEPQNGNDTYGAVFLTEKVKV